MTTEIISNEDALEPIQEEFESLEVPLYKFRGFFSEDKQVFFDCENSETLQCLNENLKRRDHDYFIVFLLVKNIESGKLLVMDVRYANIGGETLEHFIDRYNSHLKPSSIMSLEAGGKELIRYLGYSYEN